VRFAWEFEVEFGGMGVAVDDGEGGKIGGVTGFGDDGGDVLEDLVVWSWCRSRGRCRSRWRWSA